MFLQSRFNIARGTFLSVLAVTATCSIECISLKCHHLRRERRFSWGTEIIAHSRWTAREKCNRGVEVSKAEIQPRGSAGLLLSRYQRICVQAEVPSVSVILRNRPRGRTRARAEWMAARVRDNKEEYTRRQGET